MIPSNKPLFNPKISAPIGKNPDMTALRAVWRSLRAEESACPLGHRLGIARRRQERLAAFPAWRIPEIIDELNQEEVVPV